MCYYILHIPSGRHFMRPTWTTAQNVIDDISEIGELYNIVYLSELLLCGNGSRFTMKYHGDHIELYYHSKDFGTPDENIYRL